MKCHNCGFDAENNAICPICGKTMPENTSAPEPQMNADSSTNPYQQPAEPQYNAPQQPSNHFAQPYENPYAPQYENPYAQQPAAQYSPQHYESPYAQPSQKPVYQQPAEPQYNAPQQPNPNFQNTPSNYSPAPASPKKSNGTAVVVTAVVASVVVVGIIIAVLSVTLFKNSIFNIPDRYDNDHNDYYDDSDYNYEEIKDDTIREIGETFSFDYGEITLKNVEIAKKYDDGKCQYAFTVEVKNVTSEAQTYELWYDLLDSQYNYANSLENKEIGDGYMEFIYTSGDYNYSDFELKSGEATEFVMYYNGLESKNVIYPEITLSDFDYYKFSGTTHYKVDLSKLTETTEKTTENTTEETTKATKDAK